MRKFLLKMIWNRRNKVWEILVEQFFIVLVLMLCLGSLFSALKKYNDPGLLNTDNTFVFSCMPVNFNSRASLRESGRITSLVVERLRTNPAIESVTVGSGLAPYMRDGDNYSGDTVRINDKKIMAAIKTVDKYALDVFDIRLEEGEWFTGETKLADGSLPVVVSRQLVDAVGWVDAVGKKFVYRNRELTVIGVVAGVKHAVFEPSSEAILFPFEHLPFMECVAKVKKGHEADFYNACDKEFKRAGLNNDVELFVSPMEEWKAFSMVGTMLSVAAQAVPAFFLFIFAFIGTFGLFWLQSKKRLKEYALQLALGATRRDLMKMVLGESLLSSVMASIPSVLLAFFIYDFTVENIAAVVTTILLMCLFSLFSAWYPAYRISRVNPAEVLHYE